MQGDSSLWRFAFLGGMAAGSLAVGGLMPEAFEAIPSAFPMARAVVAGLLVGYGSALSNVSGCGGFGRAPGGGGGEVAGRCRCHLQALPCCNA